MTLNRSFEAIDTEQTNTIRHVWNPTSASDIHDATNALPTNGGTVVLHQDPDSQPLTLTQPITDQGADNVTLRGTSRDAVEITVDSSATINGIELTGVDGWLVHDLTIDGNGANVDDGGSENNQVGIYCEDTNYTRVTRCRLHNTKYANVRARAVNSDIVGMWIDHNICDTTYGGTGRADDNISLTGASVDAILRRWMVAHNRCLHCSNEAIEISGEADEGAVIDNTIINADEQGINIHDGFFIICHGNTVLDSQNTQQAGALAVGSDYSIASSNTVINSGDIGIQATEGPTLIIGNTVDAASEHGIEVRAQATVTGNLIRDSGGAAVEVINPEGNLSTVSGNHVKTCNRGIRSFADRTTINGNVIDNPTNHGITSAGVGVLMVGNTVDNADTALRAAGDETVMVANQASNSTTGIGTEQADARLVENITGGNGTDYDDSGTRTRWNGIIGGGPLGGVDLGSVTGQHQGDQAYADGTTAAVSDVIAMWDGANAQWVYPDSTGTV